MIQPHGGTLINKELPKNEKERILGQQGEFEKISISNQYLKIVKNIALGIFSPLEGFMNKNDYLSVLDQMYLEKNIAWPFPIVLDVSENELKNINIDDSIILIDKSNKPIALMNISDIYDYDKKFLAEKVYRSLDKNHPGVYNVFNQKNKLVGGEVFLINRPQPKFTNLDLTPIETRVLFKAKKWDRVVAFQTRNPPHIGHEYVQKAGLTYVDGLFINPVIGKKKKGDFKDELIIKTYEALINNYFKKDKVVLGTFETEMRYAGPKEAIFHAIVRKNFGCDNIIIGRDHAGVGNYYGPYDAHKIFELFPDLGIEPIFFRSFSRCKKCGTIVNEKICPHPPEMHIFFSGTSIRDLIKLGKNPSPDIMRPEIVNVIRQFDKPFVE